jgi:hypothetical protein
MLKYKLKRADGSTVDAQFTLHIGATWNEVTLAASGGSPGEVVNPDYTECLDELLARLGRADAIVVGILISSVPYSKHAISERILLLERYRYPINIAEVGEVTALRAEITKVASHTLSEALAGGNPRRRISLLVSMQAHGQPLSEAAFAGLLSAQAS